MKHARLTLVLAILSLAVTPAFAASVTMLQFGSFETRAEAEKRLAEVKAKHTAALAALPTSIREVKLPPDNLTVYRTQAGPLETRSAAQNICSKLASAGDECYVVQTAMLDTKDVPVVTAAQPVVSMAPAEIKPEVKGEPSPSLATRDESSREALASVSSTLTAPSLEAPAVSAPLVATPPSPEMAAALDKAASEQAKVESSVSQTTAAVSAEHRPGFWSRVNPFAGSKATTGTASAEPMPAPLPTPAAAEPQPIANAAPLEIPPAAKVEMPMLEKPGEAAPVATQPVVAETLPPQPVAIPASPSPAPLQQAVALEQQALAPMPMRLPPPPAPLKAQDREQLANAPASYPQPQPTGEILQPKPDSGNTGIVKVEEAKRVPVTESIAVAPVSAPVAPVAATTALQPPVALNPSATHGLKTVWAQIGPFSDGAAAYGYWAAYRQTHPDFPVVRVRVTNPYQQQLRGNGETWLRVGPVMREGFVRSLCAGVPKEGTLRCGVVTDLGVAAATQRTPGMLPASRYAR